MDLIVLIVYILFWECELVCFVIISHKSGAWAQFKLVLAVCSQRADFCCARIIKTSKVERGLLLATLNPRWATAYIQTIGGELTILARQMKPIFPLTADVGINDELCDHSHINLLSPWNEYEYFIEYKLPIWNLLPRKFNTPWNGVPRKWYRKVYRGSTRKHNRNAAI